MKAYFFPWPDTIRAARRRAWFAAVLLAALIVPSNLANHPWSPLHKDQPWQVRMFTAFAIISAVEWSQPWIAGSRRAYRLIRSM